MIDPRAISEIVDVIALEKPLDWESFNYDAVKEVAIVSMIEHFQGIINDPEFTGIEKAHALIGMLSYLTMENTQLWIELNRLKG